MRDSRELALEIMGVKCAIASLGRKRSKIAILNERLDALYREFGFKPTDTELIGLVRQY
jgi:hypothetical protein